MIRMDLTLEQIARAMNAARRNSRALIEDARILLAAGRRARAAALAILSIEESGKVDVFRCLVGARDAQERLEFLKDLTSHRVKNAHWIIGALRESYPFPMLMRTAIQGSDGAHTAYLDKLKQAALYTDFDAEGACKEPESVVSHALARELIHCASELASDAITTARELELLRRHLTTCESFEQLPATFAAYYHDLMAEGLWSGDVEALIAQLGFTVTDENPVRPKI